MQDLGGFQESLLASVAKFKVQAVDTFMQKVLQLYQTMEVRFGVTVVGPSGSGKSTAWRILADALSAHASKSGLASTIATSVLNPKSVDMKVNFRGFNFVRL